MFLNELSWWLKYNQNTVRPRATEKLRLDPHEHSRCHLYLLKNISLKISPLCFLGAQKLLSSCSCVRHWQYRANVLCPNVPQWWSSGRGFLFPHLDFSPGGFTWTELMIFQVLARSPTFSSTTGQFVSTKMIPGLSELKTNSFWGQQEGNKLNWNILCTLRNSPLYNARAAQMPLFVPVSRWPNKIGLYRFIATYSVEKVLIGKGEFIFHVLYCFLTTRVLEGWSTSQQPCPVF